MSATAPTPIITSSTVILGGVSARVMDEHVVVDLGRDGLVGMEGDLPGALFVGLVTLARAYAASIGDDATASCTLQGLAENLELGWL